MRCTQKMIHVKWQLLYLSVAWALVQQSSRLFSTEERQSLKQKQVKQMMLLMDGNDWSLWLTTARNPSLHGKLLLLSQLCDYNLQVILFSSQLQLCFSFSELRQCYWIHSVTIPSCAVCLLQNKWTEKKTFQPGSPGLRSILWVN